MFGQSRADRRHLVALSMFALSCMVADKAAAAVPQIAMANEHTVLLRADGTVWHWGMVDYVSTKLTHPYCEASLVSIPAPAQVTGLSDIVAVAADGVTSFALQSNGAVWQWGTFDASLASSCRSGSIASLPTKVTDATGPLHDVTGIWARFSSFFVRRSDNTLWAWGSNRLDKLGVHLVVSPLATTPPPAATKIDQPLQVQFVGSSTPPLAVAPGGTHTLALLFDGNLTGWGGTQYGERGTTQDTSGFPVWYNKSYWYDSSTTAAIDSVVGMAVGLYKSLAVKSDGSLWVWGCNQSGELGDGIPRGSNANVPCQRVPLQVKNLSGVAAVATGEAHTTILKGDGTVWGMGYNGYSALAAPASPATQQTKLVPIQIPGLSGVTAIDAINYCSTAMTNDGKIWQWGWCNKGQTLATPTQASIANVAVAPVCGISQGNSFVTAPNSNLCLIGSASAVTGNGPWNWTCGGFGGKTVSCSATNGPVFALEPAGATVLPLATVTLTTLAVGKGPISYQWYKADGSRQGAKLADRRSVKGSQVVAGSSVAGSATAQLVLTVVAADAGSYFVEARDSNGGTTRSRSAQIVVKTLAGPIGSKRLP